MARDRRPEPLYRKVNTRTHGVHHHFGGDAADARNIKAARCDTSSRGKMGGKERRGLDYTPLFKFLLSRVGRDWDAVHSEAVARLDRPDPIFWMVAERFEDAQAFIRVGESSYYSGLYVDDTGRLALVEPDLKLEDMRPSCPCCTHTFNGKRFIQTFEG